MRGVCESGNERKKKCGYYRKEEGFVMEADI
jgi:hypothetical protein